MRGNNAIAAIVTCGCLVALTGCGMTPAPDPTSAISTAQGGAHFKSNAEALASAKSLYEKYLAVTDEISGDGGAGVERLTPYVTASELKEEQSGATYLAKNGLKVRGATSLQKFEIQRADLVEGSIDVYACVDFARARVINKTGADVTPKERKDRQTSLARFIWSSNGLRLTENSAWSGDSVC